ncbi:MAG: hypothetical protein WAO98_05315 [Alphaproteobacteria bacterium]
MTHPLLIIWNGNKRFFKNKNAQVATLVGPKLAPPKSSRLKPVRKRRNPVKVRLNEQERACVMLKAKHADMSVNAFIKCMILGADYDPNLREVFFMLNRELTAQGRNLNQIAKQLNSGMSPAQGTKQLEAIRNPLVQALNAVKWALARNLPMP